MASEFNSSARRCAFKLKRPDRFPIIDIGCQFTGDVDEQLPNCSEELIEYEGQVWCPFHLPSSYWKDNKPEQYLLGQQISDRIIDLAKSFTSNDVSYSLDLTGIVFPGEIRFQNISFGSVIFRKCEFLSHVTFKDCSFKYYTHFDYAKFLEQVSFYDCRFENELWFSKAEFRGHLRIDKTKTAEIRALDATFFDAAWFANFSISDRFDLSSSKFVKGLGFCRLESVREIMLIGAEISNGLTIHECPSVRANLAKAKLLGQVDFARQEFSSLSLHDATFGDALDLSISSPDRDARWEGPPDWANDPNLSFHQSRASLCFDRVKIKETADFSASHSVGQKPEAIFPKISFKGAKFLGDVVFENRTFGSMTNFQGAEFNHAPSFHNCALHQATSFYRAKFLDHKRIKNLKLARRTDEAEIATRAFRTLKLASESARARQEQARFFAEEERRNRLDPDTPMLAILASWLYQITSDYGRSFLRPALWWLAAQIIFFFVYVKILTKDTPTHSDLVVVMHLTLQQIFRPFEFFSLRAEPCELTGTYLEQLSTDVCEVPIRALAYLGAFQSILGVSLLALFLLAIRRRFKLD